MKKQWSTPSVEDLSVKLTAQSPKRGENIDSEFHDNNGNLWTSYS